MPALTWTVYGMTGQIGVLAYPRLSSHFGAELSGKNLFGTRRNVRLDQLLRLQQQDTLTDTLTEVETFGYSGNFNWEHSPAANSYANYAYTDQERTETWTKSQRPAAAMCSP